MPCKGNKGYPECDSCINREFDPFECDDCVDGSNYEPDDDFDDSAEGDQDVSDIVRVDEFLEAA